MKIDNTLSITIIFTIIAIISPILTSWINNRHSYKMKNLDIQQERMNKDNLHIKQLFEQFLSDYGFFIVAGNLKYQAEAQKSFYKCMPYVPKNSIQKFNEFYSLLSNDSIALKEIDTFMQDTLIDEIRVIINTH